MTKLVSAVVVALSVVLLVLIYWKAVPPKPEKKEPPTMGAGFNFFDTTQYPDTTPVSTGVILWGNSEVAVTTTFGSLFASGFPVTIGTGAGTMTGVGVANAQTSASGVGNAADMTDDTLFTYSLPLNSMSANGKSVRIIASGHFASNGNDKTVKVWFAGTAVISSGVVTSNNKDWVMTAEVTRVDATHVSAVGSFTVSGVAPTVTVTPNLVVSDLTANNSVLKTTGASPTTGAASDALGYFQRTDFGN